jgi:hypothetical protein
VSPSPSLHLGWLEVVFRLKHRDAVLMDNPTVLRIEEETDSTPRHFYWPALEVLTLHGM